MMQRILDPTFEQLLVRYSNLDRIALWTMLFEPITYERYVTSSAHFTGSFVKWRWCPIQINVVGCILCIKWLFAETGLNYFKQGKFFEILVSHSNLLFNKFQLVTFVGGHRVDDWIVVENRNFGVVLLDVANCRAMIRCQMNTTGSTIVEMWERNLILCANLVSDYYLIYVIELIPVLIFIKLVLVKRFKLGSAWYCYIQGLGCIKTLLIEKIEIVFVNKVTQQLIGKSMQVGHNRQRKSPAPIRRSINHL